MFLELNPGTKDAPLAKEGFTIPVANTLPDVNPDEILAGARRRHARLHQAAARRRGRRPEGQRRRPAARCCGASSRRTATSPRSPPRSPSARAELRRLINSLQRLNTTLGRKDDDLAQLVGASSRVFRAIASERAERVDDRARAAERAAAGDADARAASRSWPNVLGPTAERAAPGDPSRCARPTCARAPFALEAAPRLRDDIRPFVREAAPARARPAARRREDLADGEPGLTRTFTRPQPLLQHARLQQERRARARRRPTATRATSSTPAGSSTRSTTSSRTQDAHGPGRPLTIGGTCAVIENTVGVQEELEALLGLTGALTDPARLRRRRASTGAGRKGARCRSRPPPSAGSLTMVLFALSCFGLLLFLWLAFGGADPAQAEGLPVPRRVRRGARSWPRSPTCASPACRSARSRRSSTSTERDASRTLEIDRKYAPLERRHARDAAQQDAARPDLRRADARRRRAATTLARAAALLDAAQRRATPSSSTRSSTRSTRTRARRTGRGSRASRRRSTTAATTSTTRSATCPSSSSPAATCSRCSTSRSRRSARSCATPASCSAR